MFTSNASYSIKERTECKRKQSKNNRTRKEQAWILYVVCPLMIVLKTYLINGVLQQPLILFALLALLLALVALLHALLALVALLHALLALVLVLLALLLAAARAGTLVVVEVGVRLAKRTETRVLRRWYMRTETLPG
jgi:pheromone shutdown protein TraB